MKELTTMKELSKTVLYDRHTSLGAQIVEFGGWRMPLQYHSGILQEHLATRKRAGVFDVSHMGRFGIRGKQAVAFLQYVLSNNAAALEVGQSHYTIIPNERGGAIDDAYLYRFVEDEYLLVVNAANRETDWEYFQSVLKTFEQVDIVDRTLMLSMISLQGPLSQDILASLIGSGHLPEPDRNSLSIVTIEGTTVLLARTGYTGEPLGFELFTENDHAIMLWDLLLERGAQPVGLGARDTLRLEAGLPLYGHELGVDPEGKEIPIFSIRAARFAVSFTPSKGEFVGKQALCRQFEAFNRILSGDYTLRDDLPRLIMPVALVDKGVARAGNKLFVEQKHVGYVTSGTMVPYWKSQDNGISSQLSEETGKRAICLALLDSNLRKGDEIEIDIRGRKTRAILVPHHLTRVTHPALFVL
jgi:aminomethyltransferase